MPASYSAVPSVATGDWITAGWVNTYIGGNQSAMWVGSAAGDMEYYLSAVEKARLAKPSVASVMSMDGGGVPSWLAKTNLFPVVAAHSNSTGHSYSTAAWRDMPNSSNTITLRVTSTIVVTGFVNNYGTGTYGERHFKLNINGVDIDTHVSHESYQINQRVVTPVIGLKTNVASGSRTIKLREISDAPAHTVSALGWIAFAIPE